MDIWKVSSDCKNENEKLKLGRYVAEDFKSEPAEISVVPETCLLQGVVPNYVFVEMNHAVNVRQNIIVKDAKYSEIGNNGIWRLCEQMISHGGDSITSKSVGGLQ